MDVICPWCGSEVRLSGDICPECKHEVLPEHLEGKESGQPDEDGAQSVSERIVEADDLNERYRIESEYVCPKCGNDTCRAAEVAMTGTGLSKLMDVQHHHYLFVSCLRCGAVEIYDPSVLRGRQAGTFGSMLDLFL
ncbi:zinc ribbon domain-containing protein [Paenibacillus sp. LHD-117]|uniref:zinc ribbon domain-containing protein n=1 Tax=Paenibacillus sp. LHD-117 TaxID=3071412 RepID=UPI0027E0BC8B|nr:zinc ribbon domain-containing protein [Paenibacillus sp. LHD-117]MDQ6420797.1 zinc ribbon domain-containing protein [Paenibacillus sp. LHD-117]